MIVTIEVKPELAHRWRAIAEREGRAFEAVAAQAAEAGTDVIETVAPELAARREAIQRARGSMRGVPGTVDEFLRERHECDNL